MSELDEVERLAKDLSLIVEKSSRKSFAAAKNGRKVTALLRERGIIAMNQSLRLSAHTPSLPKLKFLEGKDE